MDEIGYDRGVGGGRHDSDAGIVPLKTDFKQNILICLRSLQSNSKNKLLWDSKVR